MVEDLDLKIEPLTEVSDIYQADGTALKLLGTVRMFLESNNLNGRHMIKCTVIEAGTSREILISIEYLKKWNLLHPTFLFESVDNYVERKSKDNKYSAVYTNLSNKLESSLYQESRVCKEPSAECKKLREDILKRQGMGDVSRRYCQRNIGSIIPEL